MRNQRALTAETSNLRFSIALAENKKSIDISSGYKASSPKLSGEKSYHLEYDSRGILLFYLQIPKISNPTKKTKNTFVETMLQLVYVLSSDRREYWKVEHHVDLKRHQHTPLVSADAKPIKNLFTNLSNDLQALHAFLFSRITQLTAARHRLKTFSILSSIAFLIGGLALGGNLANADIYIALGTCICLCLSIGLPMMIRGRLKRKLILNTCLLASLNNSPLNTINQDAKSLLQKPI